MGPFRQLWGLNYFKNDLNPRSCYFKGVIDSFEVFRPRSAHLLSWNRSSFKFTTFSINTHTIFRLENFIFANPKSFWFKFFRYRIKKICGMGAILTEPSGVCWATAFWRVSALTLAVENWCRWEIWPIKWPHASATYEFYYFPKDAKMLNIGNFLFSFFFLLFGSVSALIIFPTFYYFKNMTKDQNFVTSGLRMIFLVSKQS